MRDFVSLSIWLLIASVQLAESDVPIQEHTMFPKGFKFGVATASYQVEGGWDADGKGPSIWDNMTHTNPGFIAHNDNGDIADDSYHKYQDDVQLIKAIGFQMYRFSISWPRVLPNGRTNYINQPGIQYYMNLIDALLANGIEPVVTLYHWDLPQSLQDINGWMNPDMADIFAEYADLMFQTYGNKVKYWITINEPQSIVKGYGAADFAPALNQNGVGDYISGHNLLRAHAKAYRIYRQKYFPTQQGKVGMAVCGSICFPKTQSPEDLAAAERCFQFSYGWFAHPLQFGDYHPTMRSIIDDNSRTEGRASSRLPTFTAEEIQELRGSADFFGINYYSPFVAQDGITGPDPSNERDARYMASFDPSWIACKTSWMRIVPQGLRLLINKMKTEYNNPEILITENGVADDGSSPIDDPERIAYYEGHAAEVRRAIYEDGANVSGYIMWSIMDNFEWRFGYTLKFGMVNVNYNDPARTRTWKKSATWWQHYLAMHSLQ